MYSKFYLRGKGVSILEMAHIPTLLTVTKHVEAQCLMLRNLDA